MSNSTNPRARRQVLAQVKQVKERIDYLSRVWTVPGTVHVPDPGGNYRRRPRRADEYPESDATQWAVVAAQARSAILELEELAAYAEGMLEPLAAQLAEH